MEDYFAQNQPDAMSDEKKNKKILIVDDERMFAFLLARLLRSRGYGASFVYSAEKALDRINTERYDLVIADIRMDGMSGYEMIKQVISQYGANSPRFLVGTGTQFTLDEREMKALNIHKILEKPFPRPSRLFREIEAAINSASS